MRQFNLFRERPPRFDAGQEGKLTEASRLEVDASLVEELERAQTPEERQQILNQIFTSERRDRMKQAASRDERGTPVRYYRRAKWNELWTLLQKGSFTAKDKHPRPDEVIPEADRYTLRNVLLAYLDYQHKVEPFVWKEGLHKHVMQADLQRLFYDAFPNVPRSEVQSLLSDLTPSNVTDFLQKYIERGFRSFYTTQGYYGFMGRLPASYGAPVYGRYRPDIDPVIELILPDEQVGHTLAYTHPFEREVHFESIPIEAISRVFTTEEQIEREVIAAKDGVVEAFVRSEGGWLLRWLGSTRTREYKWSEGEPITRNLPKDLLPPRLRQGSNGKKKK